GKGAAYDTDLRDKKHGRIYRIVYKEAKAHDHITLRDATAEKLVETLKNDNMFWRLQAQRLLVERGNLDVVPGLVQLADDDATDAIRLNPAAIHALWTLQGLNAIDVQQAEAVHVLERSLRHPSAGVRRTALQILPL